MDLLILYALLAIGVSFLCSIMEASLLSTSPSYAAALARADEKMGARLQTMKEDVDRPLAAILSLNTIANTAGAVGVGAQAAIVFGDAFVAITSAVLTLLILVCSEIIPKTIGALYWRTLIPYVVALLRPIMVLMWPFVQLSRQLRRLLAGREPEQTVSREELTALAELGAEEGVFEAEESRILQNLLRFSSLRVRDIMTPRTVVYTLPESTTVEEVIEGQEAFRFSRIPVYGETREDITGFVLKDEILLKAAQEQQDVRLQELRRNLLVVPETLPLPDLFERLLDRLEHIALVVDEYGGMAGVVSMEDVVETLLGLEIVDEADSVEDMQKLARQQWLRRARRLGIVPEDFEAGASTTPNQGNEDAAREDVPVEQHPDSEQG